MRNDGNYADRIINLVYPRRCPVCDEPVPAADNLICEECRPKLRYIEGARCRKCGKRLTDETRIYCGDCEHRVHIFDYGYALYSYREMHDSIYRFKSKGRCEYARFYAGDICRHLKDEIDTMGAQALIPVPLHASRERERGYNQSELLAKEMSRLLGIPVRSDIVKRVQKTVPQKELDELGRQNNLKKAFFIGTDVVKLKKVIVVDDVYTTGSTVDAVARELKEHGVGKVYFITLCIGEGI